MFAPRLRLFSMKVILFLAGFGVAILLCLCFVAWTAKRTYGTGLTTPSPGYLTAVARPGAAADAAAFDRLMTMFNAYDVESLKNNVPKVYAEDAWFRDGVKELNGSEAITEYLADSVKSVRSVSFDFESPQGGEGGDYYLPWVMNINLNMDPEDRISHTLGVSHLKFNAAGEVIFQQDYWDPSEFLHDRVPVANWLLGKVRKRL